MKSLHRPDLYGWAIFDEARNIDFNSVLWVRDPGNVVIDPVPLSDHDRAHLAALGGISVIVVTNSDHTREAAALAAEHDAVIVGPRAEQGVFEAHRWVGDRDEIVPGLRAFELHGSKTPGELALLLQDTTLITGDLIRAHRAGSLHLLPDAKLTDKAAALESARRLAALEDVQAVLVGDGWPVFRDGRTLLQRI